jgi:hypothetical protein
MTLAVDLGTLTIKIATASGVTTVPAPDGPAGGIRAALATAGPHGGLCIALPEMWLGEEVSGASLQEDVRHECEDVAGTGPVTWTGQLAAVAALTAKQRGPGRYLVCDVGGSGVRAGMFGVSDGTVEVVATDAADGGGWRDFDAAIRSRIPAELPGTWYEQAARQGPRAGMVLEDAAASPEEFGGTRVYRISGPGGDIDLTAKHVIDSFAPTLRRMRAVVEPVTGAGQPEAVVLTGGLGWLPLTVRALAESAGASPLMADLDAAARGALLFASREVRLAPPAGCPAVTLPTHRIHAGLLEEVSVTLPWTAPFAAVPDGALIIDRDELELTVAAQTRTAQLPGLVPGPHRAGVRPTWPGSGVLVVRPVNGESVHVVPLASLTARSAATGVPR